MLYVTCHTEPVRLTEHLRGTRNFKQNEKKNSRCLWVRDPFDSPPPPPERRRRRRKGQKGSWCLLEAPAGKLSCRCTSQCAQVSAGVGKPHMDSEGASGCTWSPARATAPSPGRPTPGVVKQDKSSGGSVDTTKTRSGPQRVRMSSGERPMGAAKGKQSDTEALCHPPPLFPRRLQPLTNRVNTDWNGAGGGIRYPPPTLDGKALRIPNRKALAPTRLRPSTT